MRIEETATVRQATMKDAIVGISGLIENAMTALITSEGHSRIAKTANCLEAMLWGLFNKAIDQKLRFVKFENRLLLGIENVAPSTGHVAKLTEAVLDNQDFIAPVPQTVEKETEKALEIESRQEDQRCKLAVAEISIGARSTSSNDRPTPKISDRWTIEKVYSEMSGKAVLELLAWKEVMASSKSTWYTSKSESEIDVPGLKVIELGKDYYTTTVNYLNY